MADQINDVLDVLKQRVESTIPELTVSTVPGVEVVVPMLTLDTGEINYDESFRRGGCTVDVPAVLYVSAADNEAGLLECRAYLAGHGDRSLRAAIETPLSDEEQLVGRVVVHTGERVASDQYIQAVFAVQVHLSGPTA